MQGSGVWPTYALGTKGGCAGETWPNTHRSMESFCAKRRQSLPRELGASRLLQIFWRMDSGILKAYGPSWVVTVLPGAEQKVSREPAGVWKGEGGKVRRAESPHPHAHHCHLSLQPSLPGDWELTELPVTPNTLGSWLQLLGQSTPPPLEFPRDTAAWPAPSLRGTPCSCTGPQLMQCIMITKPQGASATV